MFEINYPNNINVQKVKNSLVCNVDNFYKDPDEVVKYIESYEAGVHKENQQPSYNKVYFSDLRHIIKNKEIESVYKFVAEQFNSTISGELDTIYTNKTLWFDNDFNNFRNNYWWPHIDPGRINCLIYFDSSGTNLYELKTSKEAQDKVETMSEHYAPWRPREDFEIIYKIEAKYNRLVIFDGTYYHGAAVWDKTYFKKYRLNQVFFMNQNG